MTAIDCFLLEPTDRAARYLRRYRSTAAGETHYHSAMTRVGDAAAKSPTRPAEPDEYQDEHWPAACECGEPFADDDNWQIFHRTIYRRVDTGDELTLDDAPVGAMWYADWMLPQWAGPDGRCLMVKTPGGDWCIDGPATGGGRWQRSGVPPNATASPSIGKQSPDGGWLYHGWLRDGQLVDA